MFLFQSSLLEAQINVPYHIGSIGMMGSTGTVYSGPVVIDSKSCLMIKNGVNDFAMTQNAFFSLKCIIDPNVPVAVPVIQLIAFPNPVMTMCTIKLQNQSSIDVSPVMLVFISSDGKVFDNITTSMKELSTGYTVNLSRMNTGIYTIKIMLNSQIISTLKIIKAN
jgi:hypothetical protein